MNKIWELSHRLYTSGRAKWAARGLEILNNIISSNGISTKAAIGNGTVFYHHGVGCVVHDDAVIGEHCKIFANVTIGNKWEKGKNTSGPPHIGNNVMIGAGAVILGEIEIGDNVIIGANAVVINDIPSNSTAVGIPARIIRRECDNENGNNGGRQGDTNI